MIVKRLFGIFLVLFCFYAAHGMAADAWYVDNAASGSNNGTSWVNAWESFADVVWGVSGVKAGDILYISGGTSSKTYNETLTVGASGTSLSAPITVKIGQDSNHNGTANINSIVIDNMSFVTISGNYSGNRKIACNGAISARSSVSPVIEYLTVMVLSGGNSEEANDPVVDFRYAKNWEYSHNYMDIRGSNYGPAINCTAADHSAAFGQASIHHNTILIAGQADGRGHDGIQGTNGLDIYNNTIISTLQSYGGAQHQDLIQMQASYQRIYNNTFQRTSDSFIDYDAGWNEEPQHIRIYNNVFQGGSNMGIRFYGTGSGPFETLNDVVIANNTFVDVSKYGGAALDFRNYGSSAGPTITNVYVQNNVFYNCEEPVYSAAGTNLTAADFHFDYNLINAGASGASSVALDGSAYTQDHPLTSAPSFVGYVEGGGTSNDLRLSAGDTAAKEQGVDLSSYFTNDKNGVTRPIGLSWDIGAYEFNLNHTIGSGPQFSIGSGATVTIQ